MKPVLLSLLLLPLASCTTTKPVDTAAQTAPAEAHAKKGKHHHGKTAKAEAPAKKDAASLAVKPYPLKTCLVTGDKLDPDDEIITTTYKGQEVKLCCRDCLKKFKKNPEKYLAKLN